MKTKIPWFAIAFASIASAFGQPVITVQPQDQTNYVGTTATFTVAATGTGPLFYQWQKNSTNFADIPDSTNAALILTTVQTNDATDYRVIVTDSTGTTNSAAAHLFVIHPATLSIAQSAPGMVTFSWNGNMVLLEAFASELEAFASDSLDCVSWFRVGDTSPVSLPVKAGSHYFRLVALPSPAALQTDFQMNLDKCRLGNCKACEECVADFFLIGPTGALRASLEAEEACAIGVELGSCVLPTAQGALGGLGHGFQPRP